MNLTGFDSLKQPSRLLIDVRDLDCRKDHGGVVFVDTDDELECFVADLDHNSSDPGTTDALYHFEVSCSHN